MSYAGAMGFGFTTARDAVPDARELSTALQESLDELVARSRPPAGRKRTSAKGTGRATRTAATALTAG
jgi:hypothetical protein